MKQKLDPKKMPAHIGFILDGNRRWAKQKGLSKYLGHKAGLEKGVKNLIQTVQEYGIKVISLYCFSTENWDRDQEEIDYIFQLVRDHVGEFEKENPNIVVRSMGDLSRLPADVQAELERVKKLTENNTGLIVNLAVNYGSRDEVLCAVNKIVAERIKTKDKSPVTLPEIKKYLYTFDLPDPDLIVRTSGEMRLSNFMLFQAAYSELYFPSCHWPDFNKKELKKALIEFQKRNRRFGGN